MKKYDDLLNKIKKENEDLDIVGSDQELNQFLDDNDDEEEEKNHKNNNEEDVEDFNQPWVMDDDNQKPTTKQNKVPDDAQDEAHLSIEEDNLDDDNLDFLDPDDPIRKMYEQRDEIDKLDKLLDLSDDIDEEEEAN